MKMFARYTAKCEFCGQELVDTLEDPVFQFCVGWADADGNFLEPVQRQNRWAHAHCVDEAERQQQAKEKDRQYCRDHKTETNVPTSDRLPADIVVEGHDTNAVVRFFRDKNGDVIDRLYPEKGAYPYYFMYAVPTQRTFRDTVVVRRLEVLVEGLLINRHPSEKYQRFKEEAWALQAALSNAVRASALNLIEPALTSRERTVRSPQPNQGLQEITSISLFAADVERLLIEIYGDDEDEARSTLVQAIQQITISFCKFGRGELYREYRDAQRWDYIFGIGLPEGDGLSGSDHRRAHAALDRLQNRVREIEQAETRYGKYTKYFAAKFREHIVMEDQAAHSDYPPGDDDLPF